MKVLVLSLLRAGDLVLQRPLFEALKKQSPDGELHLLINDEVSWVAGVLHEVDHIHIFPRKILQRLLGEGDQNIFRAHTELSGFLADLNENQFDRVLNFTHNRLSAFLSEEINALSKQGLYTEGPRFHGLENKWLKLFNDRFAVKEAFPFHYTEILAQIFNLKINPPSAPGNEKISRIFLQIFTSDSKKNWGLANFRNLLNELYAEYPNLSLKVLAAENERARLSSYFENDEICTWDLKQIDTELGPSDLLITGDTVTMHIAAQKSARIIEIALGPSDPWKTGPYASDHYIITSKVACWPCVHSKPCPQVSHLCAEPITPKTITTLIRRLRHKGHEVAVLSPLSARTQLFQSAITPAGYNLISTDLTTDQRVLNKIIWQKILNPECQESRTRYDFGISEAKFLDAQSELKENLYILQNDFESLVKNLGLEQLTLFDVQKSRRRMASIQASALNQEWIWMFTDLAKLSFSTPLHFLSAFQDRLEFLKGAIFYREQIINPNQREQHESGPRTISESGLAET